MSLQQELFDAALVKLQEHVPKAVAEALEDKAGSENSEILAASMNVLADFARQHGTEGINVVADNLRKVLNKDGSAAAIQKLYADGVYLSDVTDALQTAEAAAIGRADAFVGAASEALLMIGKIVAQAAIVAASGDR